MTNKLEKYINETCKHLFKLRDKEIYFKVFTHERDGKKLAYEVIIDGDDIRIQLYLGTTTNHSTYQVVQSNLFNQGQKQDAVKHWKGFESYWELASKIIHEFDETIITDRWISWGHPKLIYKGKIK